MARAPRGGGAPREDALARAWRLRGRLVEADEASGEGAHAGGERMARAPRTEGPVPERPSREQIERALAAVDPAARSRAAAPGSGTPGSGTPGSGAFGSVAFGSVATPTREPDVTARGRDPRARPTDPGDGRPRGDDPGGNDASGGEVERDIAGPGSGTRETRARAAAPHWTEGVPVATGGITRLGTVVVGGFVAALIAWGGLMPLRSAVIMPGQLVPAGQHQRVQHEVGGRVLAILRADGDAVAANEIILRLDPVDRRAAVTELRARRARLLAMRDHLRAASVLAGASPLAADASLAVADASPSGAAGPGEGSGLWMLRGERPRRADPASSETDTPGAAALQDAQLAEFRAGRARVAREVEGLEAKREAALRQGEGLERQIEAQETLRALVRGDIDKLAPLAERGLIARRRVDELRRSLAEMDGRIAALRADLRAKRAQGTEIAAAIGRAREGDREALAERLTRVLGELAETEDRLTAASQALGRSDIRAPVAGTLVKMTQTTLGGVVAPGEVVAEIVPRGTPLIAEGRARPDDIASLAIGGEAEVVLTAHRGRDADPVPATVAYVAADTTRDGEDGEPYYTVRLALDPPSGMELQAGMQAELYLRGESRTFLSYLFAPLTESLSRAFREG